MLMVVVIESKQKAIAFRWKKLVATTKIDSIYMWLALVAWMQLRVSQMLNTQNDLYNKSIPIT